MTIEDPIEFLHRDKKSHRQPARGRGRHQSVRRRAALALRQDPDVILVGEMRDYETIETALTAAETGHLVLSTLHTLDATETINRIISVFPPHQQKQIRLQLAAVLKAVDLHAPGAASRRHGPGPGGRGADRARRTSATASRTRRRPSSSATRSRRAPAVRDADLRPVALPAVQDGSDHARRGAAAATNPDEFKLKIQGIQSASDDGGGGDGADDAVLRPGVIDRRATERSGRAPTLGLPAGAETPRQARPVRGRVAPSPRRSEGTPRRRSTRPWPGSRAQKYVDDDAYAERFARSRLGEPRTGSSPDPAGLRSEGSAPDGRGRPARRLEDVSEDQASKRGPPLRPDDAGWSSARPASPPRGFLLRRAFPGPRSGAGCRPCGPGVRRARRPRPECSPRRTAPTRRGRTRQELSRTMR